MNRLTPLAVKHAKPGRHADGKGLYLFVKDAGSRSWVLRVQVDGRRRDIGLGSVDDVTLAEARDVAREARKQAKAGLDPVTERKRARGSNTTFEIAAAACHASLRAGWKNKKHSDAWLACLKTYAFPLLGKRAVSDIDGIAVRDMLAPIWLEVPETARRVLQRTGAVLDFAHIKGWRSTEAGLRSVRKGLPKQPADDDHHEAMPYEDVPAYYASVAAAPDTLGRSALRFTILTAVRSGETRLAARAEFDLKKAVWTIPAIRMKTNEVHQVPLSPAAIAIVQPLVDACATADASVFSANGRTAISDATMRKVLRGDGYETLTVHGFRSSFTDWAAEMTDFPKEVVDKALAHKIPDRVEAAYRRTDFFKKRRQLMDAWAAYVAPMSCGEQEA